LLKRSKWAGEFLQSRPKLNGDIVPPLPQWKPFSPAETAVLPGNIIPLSWPADKSISFPLGSTENGNRTFGLLAGRERRASAMAALLLPVGRDIMAVMRLQPAADHAVLGEESL
jgi:hypothetical protein